MLLGPEVERVEADTAGKKEWTEPPAIKCIQPQRISGGPGYRPVRSWRWKCCLFI